MIIKNQNAPDLIACGICLGRVDLLLDDENLLRPNAGLPARRRKVKQVGMAIFDGPNEARRELHCPIPRAFPFHDLTLWRNVASPPWRVCGIFSCHLRGHTFSFVRDRNYPCAVAIHRALEGRKIWYVSADSNAVGSESSRPANSSARLCECVAAIPRLEAGLTRPLIQRSPQALQHKSRGTLAYKR